MPQLGGGPTKDEEYEVKWESGDAANPRNWSVAYKTFVLLTISWNTLMVVIGATAYTSGISQMQAEFAAPSEAVVTLGLTTYLLGWVLGSLILAPLSEMYGRRWVYLISTAIFVLLMLPCAQSSSLAAIICFRFLSAVAGAGVIALSPGTISDISNDDQRALAYSVWSIGPFTAPAIGPLVGGFVVESLGWRWVVWIIMIGAAGGCFLLLWVSESYTPVLLTRKSAALRKSTNNTRWWSRFDNHQGLGAKLKLNLTRPFALALTEPMLLLWNSYIGLIYGVLYLSFTAYPIVFQRYRGWSVSMTGLSFLGLGTGSFCCIISEPFIRRFIKYVARKKESPQPEATISILCIAAILLPLGEFWFAWTSIPPVHWIWPILAGVPFGAGATANFIYAINYLAHSYGIYAASVMAGNTVWRCTFGALLPLAGPALFIQLGPHWGSSLLAFVLFIMAPIPFNFCLQGTKIRARSSIIAMAREEEARLSDK